MSLKGRIAFIKFGGLSTGGTERWLQTMAVLMQHRGFAIDYFYCDTAPYIGSDFKHPDTDAHRKKFLEDNGISLIKFRVGFKDITKPTHDWVETDFWEIFDQTKYDLVQTAKAGPAEYPYHLIKIPIIEYVTLSAGVDHSVNIAWSIHCSQWQRKQWMNSGGDISRSSVIPVIPDKPIATKNLRQSLGIPDDAFVAGLHQRDSADIYSDWPLAAFKNLPENSHFILLGGSDKYVEQARALGINNFHKLSHIGDPLIISTFLNSLDVYLHGRKDGETFGNVLAEALLHGVPCISHRSLHGANAQIETIGPGGFFLESKKEYKEKLLKLYSDSDLRKNLGLLGKAHAEKQFSADNAAETLESLYMRIIHGTSDSSISSTPPLPYAFSHLGYLVAGDLEDKSAIESHALYGGCPEKFDVKISNLLNTKSGTVYFDVGANSGLYSPEIAFHNSSAQIYAFEPQPECALKLEATVDLNRWSNRFSVVRLGLSDEKGELSLSLSGSGSTFDDAFNDFKSRSKIECEVDTLDNYVEMNSIARIDFIKIDVEGYETQVLMGARRSIGQFRPMLFVEVARTIIDRDYLNLKFEKVFDFAHEMNYVSFRSNGKGMIFPRRKKSKIHHIHMYLLVPREIAFSTSIRLMFFMTFFHISNILDKICLIIRRLSFKITLLYQILKSNCLLIKHKITVNGRLR
jgi:FkbM family methyltransferase